MSFSLDTLLSPRSVAVVGASENATRIGGRPLRYMREGGFRGAVYPVNPTRETVQGLKSYASVADLPEAPDVAILSVPAEATEAAVRDCVTRGVKAAIVFSAGFAEVGADGAAQQHRLVEIARGGALRLLGPNCLGVMNPGQGFYGTFSVVLDAAPLQAGPIGIVSQSGAYGAHIAHLARQRRLGVSQWITTGNECDIDVAEALAYVVEQPETRVVMVYAEGVRNRELFLSGLERARALRKAIVFMKTGRSAVGAAAAASHTAALAGSDAVFDAILRQYGVWRAGSTAEQIDIAYACARGTYPKGNRIGIFTMSGGFGIQLADEAETAGLDVSPMPEDDAALLLAAQSRRRDGSSRQRFHHPDALRRDDDVDGRLRHLRRHLRLRSRDQKLRRALARGDPEGARWARTARQGAHHVGPDGHRRALRGRGLSRL
jgi:acyl-CoA synthetase (NDP forming)